MRRAAAVGVVAVLLAAVGITGYQIGFRNGRNAGAAAVCPEASGRHTQLLDRMMTTGRAVGTAANSDERSRAQSQLRLELHEVAVLMEQNPTCFSATARAEIEAYNRQANP
jgi:hypothetical protein